MADQENAEMCHSAEPLTAHVFNTRLTDLPPGRGGRREREVVGKIRRLKAHERRRQMSTHPLVFMYLFGDRGLWGS